MTSYDFRGLSAAEFEHLVRNLLQLELKLRLESFATGRDGGIDLRHAPCKSASGLIVQCKHYVGSGWSKLQTHLRSEANKVTKLSPDRYVLATSVGLTPANKNEIVEIFSPFIVTPGDVFGQEDLNNLLQRHPSVETGTIKLWLTSLPVLTKVLNASIHNQTAHLLQDLPRKASLFVNHPGVDRASRTLKERHACIIAGMPGIGKTMLAEMLIMLHAEQGFQPVVISSDISEANAVFDSHAKQIFYYDDFLGQTGSSEKQLGKNEDSRILAFIRRVASAPNKRLVLTTREYILAHAKLHHERISEGNIELYKCIIDLADYARFARAQILYNHLFFSKLARGAREALLPERSYLGIIDHANYSPRLIEKVVELAEISGLDSGAFLSFFRETLDHPARLWEHVIENQLTDVQRAILVAMVTLPLWVSLVNLREASVALSDVRLRHPMGTDEFMRGLRVLDGTFLTLMKRRVGQDEVQLVSIHNPSIRDYLLDRMQRSGRDGVVEALTGAAFFDQGWLIWLRSEERDRQKESRFPVLRRVLMEERARLIESLTRTMESQATEFRVYPHSFCSRTTTSPEARLRTLLEVAADVGFPLESSWLSTALAALGRRWDSGSVDSGSVVELVSEGRLSLADAIRAAAAVLQTASTVEDLVHLGELHDAESAAVSREAIAALAPPIIAQEVDHLLHDERDVDSIRSGVERLSQIGLLLGLEQTWDEDDFEQRIEQLESSQAGQEDDYHDTMRETRAAARDEDAEIVDLFDSLQDDS